MVHCIDTPGFNCTTLCLRTRPASTTSCCACGKACKACRGRTSCPANHHLAGTCGGHTDYSCVACPAHAESAAGATEASQCTCADNYYDTDTAAQGVQCKSCRTSCDGANEYVSTKCGAVDTAHGVDASCSACPAHSTLKVQSGRRLFGVQGMRTTAPQIQDCVCDGGYFDDAPALSRVHCATVPPGFGSTYTNTACRFSEFGLGETTRIDLNTSPSDTATIGAMVQFMDGVSSAVLYSADFNHLCGHMLTQYHGLGTLCGRSFPLFAKDGNTRTHVNFLGNVAVQCHNFNDVFVLLKTCVAPCMDEAKGCCWLPSDLAIYYDCCGSLGCCGVTPAPTPAPTTGQCIDMHPTCPSLKKQLDDHGESCFTADLGDVTGDVSVSGKHLVDECCASCGGNGGGGHCTQCVAAGHTKDECMAAGVCKCSFPAACRRCISVNSETFTKAQCASFGIDCTENCTQGSATRRALQGGSGGGGGTQVTASTASAARLKTLMDCLAVGGTLRSCTGKS